MERTILKQPKHYKKNKIHKSKRIKDMNPIVKVGGLTKKELKAKAN